MNAQGILVMETRHVIIQQDLTCVSVILGYSGDGFNCSGTHNFLRLYYLNILKML